MPDENLILEQTDSVDKTTLSWRYTLGKTCTALKSDHRSWGCCDRCPVDKLAASGGGSPSDVRKAYVIYLRCNDANRTPVAREIQWFTGAAHRTQVTREILWFTGAAHRTPVAREIRWFTGSAHGTPVTREIRWWVREDLQGYSLQAGCLGRTARCYFS